MNWVTQAKIPFYIIMVLAEIATNLEEEGKEKDNLYTLRALYRLICSWFSDPHLLECFC